MSGSRRSPGRLDAYVEGYHARLLEQDYSPGSVTRSLATLGHLGRWMDSRDIDAEQLDGEVLKAFLADHVHRHGQLPSAGVMPVLDYLRNLRLAGPEPTTRRSPLDEFVDEYRHWLAVERALSPDTVCGYTRLASRFLARRVSANHEVGVDGLTGARSKANESTPMSCGTAARWRYCKPASTAPSSDNYADVRNARQLEKPASANDLRILSA